MSKNLLVLLSALDISGIVVLQMGIIADRGRDSDRTRDNDRGRDSDKRNSADPLDDSTLIGGISDMYSNNVVFDE